MRRTLPALVLLAALAWPRAGRADHAVGLEVSTPPASLAVRYEWRPLRLIMPSVAAGLARDAAGTTGLLLEARLTTEPLTFLGLVGLTADAGILGTVSAAGMRPQLELGLGARAHLLLVDLVLEGGVRSGAGGSVGFGTAAVLVHF